MKRFISCLLTLAMLVGTIASFAVIDVSAAAVALKTTDKDDELFVSSLYTRRGGIDICPSRWKNCSVNGINNLLDLSVYASNGVKF